MLAMAIVVLVQVFAWGIILLTRKVAPAAAASPRWQVRCPKCGLTFDAETLGIIRIGATGSSNTFRKCGQCKRGRWLHVERKPIEVPDRAGPRCDLATHRHRPVAGAAV